MSACIYDDAPSVAVCPECDFGVCQACMDGGGEGVCKTCYDERAIRSADSKVERVRDDYTNTARRCSYCRAAEDETTTLDADGYCEPCRALARCVTHEELIAVGHCKTCRREFCRKCLGFTDVCQACTAKNKTKPLKDRAPSAAAASRPGGPKKTAKKTGPIEEVAAAKRGKTKPLQAADPSPPAKPVKKPPTRGQLAVEEKLKAKSGKKAGPRTRTQLIAVATVLAVGILLLVSGMYLHAMSPEEQARRMRDEMLTVHRGVLHYMKRTGKVPKNEEEIRRALAEMKVKGANKIKISTGSATPSTVLYQVRHSGFLIRGADSKGQILMAPTGEPVLFDQYFDSSL